MTFKKLKFLVDGIVNGELVFKAGEIYEIPVETGSVDRWLKRGAIEVEEIVVPIKEEIKIQNEVKENVQKIETPVLEEFKNRPKKFKK